MAFRPFGGSGVVHPCVVEERSVSKNVVASEGQEAVRLRVIGNEDAMELRPARASLLPGACLERPCGSVLVEKDWPRRLEVVAHAVAVRYLVGQAGNQLPAAPVTKAPEVGDPLTALAWRPRPAAEQVDPFITTRVDERCVAARSGGGRCRRWTRGAGDRP